MLEPLTSASVTAPDAEPSSGGYLQIDERYNRLATLDKLATECVFADIVLAQKYLTDILQVLSSFHQPDFKINYLLNSALVENLLYNYSLSENYFRLAVEMLEERGNVSQLTEAYLDYTGALLNLEQTERTRYYLGQAAKNMEAFPDGRLLLRLICRKGFLYLKYNNYARALDCFLEAESVMLELEEPLTLKDYYFFATIQSGLGSTYAHNGDALKSIQAYQNVVELCEKKGMRFRLSWHYNNVGAGYVGVEDFDNAIYFFRKAIRERDDVNQQARAIAYANLGFCLMKKKQYEEALQLFTTAYPMFKDRREISLANIEWWRGQIYREIKSKKAQKHFFKALDFANKGQDKRQISAILKDIALQYAQEENYKYAYQFQNLYNKKLEDMIMEEKNSEINELKVKHEAERKEKEAEMFRLQATGLQLKALRAQMNPHFIFNALNSIQHHITSNDSTNAAKYLARFAHLMRQSLEYSDLEIISLEKEIDFLRNYLDINQKLRFEDKLTYEIEVDEEIEEDICGVPTMIIQPYVENAIEHGIRMQKSGKVSIRFRLKDDNTILCTIEDDGVGRGRAAELQEKNPKHREHRSMGTKITRERLQILKNAEDGELEDVVIITDLMEAGTGQPLGTRVEVSIPIMQIPVK